MRSRFGCPPSRTEFFMLWTTRETGKRIVAGRSAACRAKFFVKYDSPWSHIKVQNSTFGANISCLALPAMFLPLSLSCTWFSCLWKLLCTSWWILCERERCVQNQPPALAFSRFWSASADMGNFQNSGHSDTRTDLKLTYRENYGKLWKSLFRGGRGRLIASEKHESLSTSAYSVLKNSVENK